MTNYKQLCAELVAIEDALMGGAALTSNQGQALDGYSALASFRLLANRARAALAEPEPERPTDGEVAELVAWMRNQVTVHEVAQTQWAKRFVRAASLLERLSPPRPIPLDERLPGPGDEEIMELMPQPMRDDLAAAARAMLGLDCDDTKVRTPLAFRSILNIFNRHSVDHARAVLARWGK